MDLKTAFLHGILEGVIHMKIHDVVHVENSSNKECLLNRSLYGVKQTPKHWYKRFDDFMISIRYDRSKYDASSSRYICTTKN